jgi:hypothetical protein
MPAVQRDGRGSSARPAPPGTHQGSTCLSTRGPNPPTDPPTDPAARDVEACFLAAFKACRSATLVFTTVGVDAGSTTTFHTVGGASCGVTGVSESRGVPPPNRFVSSFTCSGLEATAEGLLFKSCGSDGDFLVPAPRSS